MIREPDECTSIEEVRQEIDRLDRQVITSLGRRLAYVHAAARFKQDEEAVHVPERLAAMLHARRLWAAEEGLSSDVIEGMYRDLVAHFTDEELKHWRR